MKTTSSLYPSLFHNKTKTDTQSGLNNAPLPNIDGLPHNENNNLKRIAKKDLRVSNKQQGLEIKAIICTDTKKLLCLDVIVSLILIRYIYKYVITPLMYNTPINTYNPLITTVLKYKKKYTNPTNIILFGVFIICISLFLSFNSVQFQNIGIIMVMTFITSIASDADYLLSGALLSGIIAYVFIRTRAMFIATDNAITKCAKNPYIQIINIFKNITHYVYNLI